VVRRSQLANTREAKLWWHCCSVGWGADAGGLRDVFHRLACAPLQETVGRVRSLLGISNSRFQTRW